MSSHLGFRRSNIQKHLHHRFRRSVKHQVYRRISVLKRTTVTQRSCVAEHLWRPEEHWISILTRAHPRAKDTSEKAITYSIQQPRGLARETPQIIAFDSQFEKKRPQGSVPFMSIRKK